MAVQVECDAPEHNVMALIRTLVCGADAPRSRRAAVSTQRSNTAAAVAGAWTEHIHQVNFRTFLYCADTY
jgi:hypothetical protein